MAYVSDYDTQYICPICKIKLSLNFTNKKNLMIYYKHPLSEMILINEYPSPCPNNNKNLMKKDTEKIITNNIKSWHC